MLPEPESQQRKAKDNVSDFKRGVVEERENRQEQRTQKRNLHRENISQKKQELQKAQEARQTVHANGSATAGATRSHERPVATPVPKTAQTDTVIKPDMKRPATSPVIKNAEVKAEKETVRTNIRQEQQVKGVTRTNQPNVGTIFPVLFSIVLFFGILISGEDDDSSNSYSPVYSGMNLSADVLKHQPMVEKYARENGISEYVNVLLAIIQVESGGTATDVMQSSESLGLPPNSLSTEESIKQGCKYFASLLSSCKAKGMNDINVVIQSYNYGGGYTDYVAKNGKKHSFNLAENFAKNKSGGTKVTYTNPIAVSKNGGWRYNYGNMFYVELVNQYLTVKQFSNETVQAVMNEALKYQGWKYVYGGSNPNTSFDCSGLTQWCYGKAGISLPRTAQAQYDATQHIPLSQAQAGDLVFFHSTYNTSDYVTHVGIYVGNNQMYHAGNPIGYTDLTSDYWQQHIICAGRIKQ